MTDHRASKNDLRREARRRRAEAQNPQAPFALRDRFFETVELPVRAVISGYIAHDSEIDPAPLLEELHRRHYALALPVVTGRDESLSFRAWAPGDALVTRGTPALPEPPATAPMLEPDILLVPLLAFDARGHRLGQGGGYYDRTLMDLRRRKPVLAVGIAFACQQIAEVPAGPHDAVLDKIVTEIQAHSVFKPS